VGFDLNVTIPPPAPACGTGVGALSAARSAGVDGDAGSSMQAAHDAGVFDRMGAKVLP
jgi:hypothetical protein